MSLYNTWCMKKQYVALRERQPEVPGGRIFIGNIPGTPLSIQWKERSEDAERGKRSSSKVRPGRCRVVRGDCPEIPVPCLRGGTANRQEPRGRPGHRAGDLHLRVRGAEGSPVAGSVPVVAAEDRTQQGPRLAERTGPTRAPGRCGGPSVDGRGVRNGEGKRTQRGRCVPGGGPQGRLFPLGYAPVPPPTLLSRRRPHSGGGTFPGDLGGRCPETAARRQEEAPAADRPAGRQDG